MRSTAFREMTFKQIITFAIIAALVDSVTARADEGTLSQAAIFAILSRPTLFGETFRFICCSHRDAALEWPGARY